MSTVIDVPLLRAQLERVLREVEARHGASVHVSADHYWLIESAAAFDLNQEPRPAVGQLSDDADELQGMASQEPAELMPWHDLKHLVGLLEALAATDAQGDQ